MLKILCVNMFKKVNHTKKYPSQCKHCSKNTKRDTKSHCLSFKRLKYVIKNLQQSIMAQNTITIPTITKTNCKFVNAYNCVNKYANILNNAVKNAIKSVLQNSTFNFYYFKHKFIISNSIIHKRRFNV